MTGKVVEMAARPAGKVPQDVIRRLGPVVQDSTPMLVARLLREAIATGQFRPGQQLMETSLAGGLGVSRGPLREAMQRLTQEGLLVSHRNRGLFVMQLDEPAVRDMFLARLAIERAAVAQIIVTGRHHSAAVLLDLARGMSDYRDSPSSPAVSELDMKFHETLVSLADSPRLTLMHQTMIIQVRMCLTEMQATYHSVDRRVEEHSKLAQAIVSADTEEAERLLVEHMNDGLKRLLTALASDARM